MEELYQLKDMLCSELKKYGSKELSASTLDVVDKISHSIKNLDKIIEKYEDDEYSNDMYGRRSGYGNAYGMSYARGRRRDSMGRYSRDGYSRDGYSNDMMADLHKLMEQAPDDRTRQEFQRFIEKMER